MPDISEPPGIWIHCSGLLLLSEFTLNQLPQNVKVLFVKFSQQYFEYKYLNINTSAGVVEGLRDLGRQFWKIPQIILQF